MAQTKKSSLINPIFVLQSHKPSPMRLLNDVGVDSEKYFFQIIGAKSKVGKREFWVIKRYLEGITKKEIIENSIRLFPIEEYKSALLHAREFLSIFVNWGLDILEFKNKRKINCDKAQEIVEKWKTSLVTPQT